MHPKQIAIADFTYHLPNEKIALHPLEKRDQSKLLIYTEEKIKEDIYKNIADHLPANSLLIFNNTKVIPARILFKKETGGTIEIFCLAPFEENTEYTSVMSKNTSVKWKCMIGGASKWKEGGLTKEMWRKMIKKDTKPFMRNTKARLLRQQRVYILHRKFFLLLKIKILKQILLHFMLAQERLSLLHLKQCNCMKCMLSGLMFLFQQ